MARDWQLTHALAAAAFWLVTRRCQFIDGCQPVVSLGRESR